MPKFKSAELDCNHRQVLGKTTASRMRHRTRGATLTLWCAKCEDFHGFEPV